MSKIWVLIEKHHHNGASDWDCRLCLLVNMENAAAVSWIWRGIVWDGQPQALGVCVGWLLAHETLFLKRDPATNWCKWRACLLVSAEFDTAWHTECRRIILQLFLLFMHIVEPVFPSIWEGSGLIFIWGQKPQKITGWIITTRLFLWH